MGQGTERFVFLHKGLFKCRVRRFEQAFVNSLLSERGANGSRDYWIALDDVDRTGEYRWTTPTAYRALTFSNWNRHQPGEC